MVLLIATAGLVYELSIAAIASYLLGDSVRQFSLIIGCYLSALGLGAYLSKYFEHDLDLVFIDVELSAALIGGLSGPVLFLSFSYTDSFQFVLYAIVVLVGTLVGLELPLLIRLLERHVRFKDLIAKSLTFDYAGAFFGSVGFSLFLLPFLGLLSSSLSCGLLNGLVGLLSTWVLPRLTGMEPQRYRRSRLRALGVLSCLGLSLVFSDRLLSWTEEGLYHGQIEYREQSPYQRIVVARKGSSFELFLNGNLQFSSIDERRYHEALVHPAAASVSARSSGTNELDVLIGGGGDGLAVREALRWPVRSLTLVDLDVSMTNLGRGNETLRRLNDGSLHDPRVTIINRDAMAWMRETEASFDVVVLDFPDPSNYSLGKLYSSTFYQEVKARLRTDGTLVVQATSPLFARRSYWCIVTTLEQVGFATQPYRVLVPSFGEWGFVLARHRAFDPPAWPEALLLYELDQKRWNTMFSFDEQTARVDTEANRLNNQRLVGYYNEEWSRLD